MEPSDQLLIELAAQERWRDLLGEVLAVLNRDGGHYQTKHGAGRAAIEGIRSHYQMLATIDALQADNEPCGTCDWGGCDEEVVRWRYADPEHGHLPVCLGHSLEQQAEAMQRAFDRIWRLTNLPFTDNDRKGIQSIAIAFIDGKGPQPGSQVAHLLVGDKEAGNAQAN